MPSIQLGINQALLSAHQIGVSSRSFYLEWLKFLSLRGADPEAVFAGVQQVSDTYHGVGVGEWIFAVPPLYRRDARLDDAYHQFLVRKQIPAAVIDSAFAVRELVPEFLQQCAADILADSPSIVGFTTMFSQNLPSLSLAKTLKQQRPDLKIVFGGANCQGEMGVSLLRRFEFVDAVVRGESEGVLPELMKSWLAGAMPRDLPGVCLRNEDRVTVNDFAANAPFTMDQAPQPDYDEYFQRLQTHPMRSMIDQRVQLPIESSRGCWWGEKSHCTFCGLNGATMTFRAKSADRFYDELLELSRRYRRLKFFSVDNILDMQYHRHLLPRLAESQDDIQLFFEVKANIRKTQLRLMRDAGIRVIQPGIESFSTPILKLMRKGTTGLQNIRLLKYCAELGIDVVWNVIFGFPNEPMTEYDAMARSIPSLVHLQPPRLVQLVIDRYSPYHTDPAAHGLNITGPAEFYSYIYRDSPENLMDVAYHFEAVHQDGRDPGRYTRTLQAAITHWNQHWDQRVSGGAGSLTYQSGPGFVRIDDQRSTSPTDTILEGTEAAVYRAIEHGGSAESVSRKLLEHDDLSVTTAQVREILDRLQATGLAYGEGDRFLSLATSLFDKKEGESTAGCETQTLPVYVE